MDLALEQWHFRIELTVLQVRVGLSALRLALVVSAGRRGLVGSVRRGGRCPDRLGGPERPRWSRITAPSSAPVPHSANAGILTYDEIHHQSRGQGPVPQLPDPGALRTVLRIPRMALCGVVLGRACGIGLG